MMTFLRNQSTPFSWARLFTAVGLRRVSMGPPMRIMVFGAAGSFAAFISATAAITGTEGWQTAITLVSGPRNCRNSVT